MSRHHPTPLGEIRPRVPVDASSRRSCGKRAERNRWDANEAPLSSPSLHVQASLQVKCDQHVIIDLQFAGDRTMKSPGKTITTSKHQELSGWALPPKHTERQPGPGAVAPTAGNAGNGVPTVSPSVERPDPVVVELGDSCLHYSDKPQIIGSCSGTYGMG